MAQAYLDPRNRVTVGTWQPKEPIPEWIRGFGLYPDTSSWLPGDLILVSNIEPNWSHKIIEWVQRKGGYSNDDARWHHAAVYLGDDSICEADTDGVKYKPIYRYVKGKHLIRVRRDNDLDLNTRWRIALRSMTKLKEAYGFLYLPSLLDSAISGFWQPNSKSLRVPSHAKICSQLYADAYSTVTGKVLYNTSSGEITPAFLSLTSQLSDINSHWLEVPK